MSELVELATDTHTEEVIEQIDLGELVERVVTRQQRRTGREIALDVRRPATVVGRVTLLERAITNLLDNALKFSPPDTAVEVIVDGAEVEILDRGPGIDGRRPASRLRSLLPFDNRTRSARLRARACDRRADR